MASDRTIGRQCVAEVETICQAVYGVNSLQVRRLTEALDQVQKNNATNGYLYYELTPVVLGTLRAIRDDVLAGRLDLIIREALANLVLDFIFLAEHALNQGRVEVAAVLAAASFEDLMKRKAQEVGIDTTDRDLSDVINALKAAGQLGGPVGRVASSFVPFRNKALHGEWSLLGGPDVASLIGFVKNAAAAPAGL